MVWLRGSRWRQAVPVLVVLATFVPVACAPVTTTRYRAVPLTQVEASPQMFRFELVDGATVDVLVNKVEYPMVHGLDSGGRPADIDLRKVRRVGVASPEKDQAASAIKSFAVGTGIYGAILAGLVIIVILAKSSCPFVYVQDDQGKSILVGEAYSGAAFASIARDDLLPLPLPSGAGVVARLANEARETQYTDRLELVVIDHSSDLRVLSTFDARAVGAGPAVPPETARDQDGRDVLPSVRAADEIVWESDVGEIAARAAPPLRESLDLTFPPTRTTPKTPGQQPALLELTLSNTVFIDALMGRFFALMGGRLEGYLDKGNQNEAGDKIRSWREREGLDLRVEVESGGRLQPVAVVPTVGPMALRRVAVPLPFEAVGGDGRLHVRVSGGTGFWRIDQAALSRQVPLDAEVHRLAPTMARDTMGVDQRDVLRATDGRNHVLVDRGDRLDLRFSLPPRAADKQRSGFFSTRGYYNVHRPPQGDFSPLVLRDIRDRPGALAGFGIELFRSYMRVNAANVSGATAPPSGPGGHP